MSWQLIIGHHSQVTLNVSSSCVVHTLGILHLHLLEMFGGRENELFAELTDLTVCCSSNAPKIPSNTATQSMLDLVTVLLFAVLLLVR